MITKLQTQAAVMLLLLAGTFNSGAVPIIGGIVVAAGGGDVIASFQGQTAGYDSELYLYSPSGTFSTTRIFHNHLNGPGNTVNLGSFTAGTELVFMIRVLSDSNREYFTGSASRNPDGLAHAVVDSAYINPFTLGVETYVGFEDLFGGGDLDYDDLNFSFSNVRATSSSVPELTSTLPLMSLALGGIMSLAHFRRRTA
ncbi:MAG: DUF4114 domain-containing protein [Opitutaceae bacterium]|nr:DUF4114 domain-containing protein [Verrucomicrobiales bacterium]